MKNPLKQRRAGALLHPTSLPSGKIDQDAIKWLDFMQSAGLTVWQVLPLGVPQENLSPYLCYSAFAMNPALLGDVDPLPIDSSDFEQWQTDQSYWLKDFAQFSVLKSLHNNKPWYDWPAAYKNRHSHSLDQLEVSHADRLNTIYKNQFLLDRQWQELKSEAQRREISIFGDMPIFVGHDSADVWANRECFLLDENGQPDVVAGVPPDYFSETGQRWGTPHYNWKHLASSGFEWWIQRMQHHFHLYDIVRIDHFRGLEAVWMIDADCPTAIEGHWEKVPGADLLGAIQASIGDAAIVAEDLGVITPEVTQLREQFERPGMSVLQFSFDASEDNPHKPQNIKPNRVVYTGTHDNDTTLGWYESLEAHEQDFVCERLKVKSSTNIAKALTNEAMATEAGLAIVPLQDFLALDSNSRMNTPGVSEGNWQWRFDWTDIPQALAPDILHIVTSNQRQGDVQL